MTLSFSKAAIFTLISTQNFGHFKSFEDNFRRPSVSIPPLNLSKLDINTTAEQGINFNEVTKVLGECDGSLIEFAKESNFGQILKTIVENGFQTHVKTSSGRRDIGCSVQELSNILQRTKQRLLNETSELKISGTQKAIDHAIGQIEFEEQNIQNFNQILSLLDSALKGVDAGYDLIGSALSVDFHQISRLMSLDKMVKKVNGDLGSAKLIFGRLASHTKLPMWVGKAVGEVQDRVETFVKAANRNETKRDFFVIAACVIFLGLALKRFSTLEYEPNRVIGDLRVAMGNDGEAIVERDDWEQADEWDDIPDITAIGSEDSAGLGDPDQAQADNI